MLPANLLEACLIHSGCQGGTIHEYLPKLHWSRAYGPSACRMGSVPVWELQLNGKPIGWTQCYKRELPIIEPSLRINFDRID